MKPVRHVDKGSKPGASEEVGPYDMPPEFPYVIVSPIESDIRLVQLAPGVDPSVVPLLSHAGLACVLGGRIEIAMNGMTGVSDEIRQFLTTEGNDLSEELLTLLAEELSDPERRAELRSDVRGRIDQIRSDLDDIPGDEVWVEGEDPSPEGPEP